MLRDNFVRDVFVIRGEWQTINNGGTEATFSFFLWLIKPSGFFSPSFTLFWYRASFLDPRMAGRNERNVGDQEHAKSKYFRIDQFNITT